LVDIETTAIETMGDYRDFDELWRSFLRGQGPVRGFLSTLPVEERESVRNAFRESLSIRADGRLQLQARAWAVRGRV
jgi:hypothetical protein